MHTKLPTTYADNGGNEMNITTKYCAGCYQDLRPFSGCLCQPFGCGCVQPPFPPNPPCPNNAPRCGFDGSNMIYFAIGYLIAKNSRWIIWDTKNRPLGGFFVFFTHFLPFHPSKIKKNEKFLRNFCKLLDYYPPPRKL